MRNKTLLALGICLLLYLPTQAQTDTTAPKRYKWEVATDLLWLINKNNIPASSIFVRRHFVTKKGKNVALRMRLGWDFDYYKQTSYFFDRQIPSGFATNILGEVKTQSFAPFVVIGYQKSTLREKFEIFYGVDIMVKYLNAKEYLIKTTGIVFPPSFIYPTNITGVSVGANSFVGLKYPLGNHFTISTEIALGATFSKINYRMIGRSYPIALPPDQVGRVEQDADNYAVKFNILPFYVLNLSYNF